MASTKNGLTDDQVVALRSDVAAGHHPRVQISATQFGDSASGAVQQVGDPSSDGPEFITVRVKVNGVADDLRFAPRELSRGRRGKGGSASPAPATPTVPTKPPRVTKAARPTTTTPTKPARGTKQITRSGAKRASAGAPITIVLTSVGAAWTVSARKGARTVVKNVSVDPGVVSAIAGLLAEAPLQDAVAAVNDTARAEAEARADRLRAELAAVQAVLDSHRRPRTGRS